MYIFKTYYMYILKFDIIYEYTISHTDIFH